LGTGVAYADRSYSLPRTGRAGIAWLARPGATPVTLFADSTYDLNAHRLDPSLGAETRFGPLAVRGGYQRLGNENRFSIGAGFLIGRISLDTAFGLLEDVGSQSQMSINMAFDLPHKSPSFAKQPEEPTRTVRAHPKTIIENHIPNPTPVFP